MISVTEWLLRNPPGLQDGVGVLQSISGTRGCGGQWQQGAGAGLIKVGWVPSLGA